MFEFVNKWQIGDFSNQPSDQPESVICLASLRELLLIPTVIPKGRLRPSSEEPFSKG
jgi:hypothetical protein